MMTDSSEGANKSNLLQIFAIAAATDLLQKPAKLNQSGYELFWYPYQDFSLAVRYVTVSSPKSTDAILEYEAVIQMLHDTNDIIPIRFGTTILASQIPTLINDRQGQLKHALTNVAGCSEMLLRWSISEDELIGEIGDGEIGDGEIGDGEIDAPQTITLCANSLTGRDYLRKKYFESIQLRKHDALASEAKQTVESILGNSVQGVLARIMDVNMLSPGASTSQKKPIIALDLLVKKERFSEVFPIARSIHVLGNPPILVRGPLPIYSFAESTLALG